MSRGSDLEFRIERAKRLERALRNKGWTRVQLGTKAGYDEKTIRNLLTGEPVRDQTIIDVSKALEVDPQLENTLGDVDVADDVFGGYLRHTHRNYEGFYCMYRRGFTRPQDIFKSICRIEWDNSSDYFVFSEYYQEDSEKQYGAKAHEGVVYMSSYTNLLHLMTVYEGSIRLATMTKMRETEGIMRGSLLTQSESLMFFQPTVAPIVLAKLKQYDPEKGISGDLKFLTESDEDYKFANEQIGLTEKQIVRVSFGG
jgi:lambda repressor-like predicted transcriptional regulator